MIERFTIVTQRLDNPFMIAYDRILRKYGHGCVPSESIDEGEYWRVPIECYYPKHIYDELTNKEKVLTFHYKNIGNIIIDKKTHKISSLPSVKELKYSIIDKKIMIRKSVEKDLVKVIGDPKLKINFGKMKFALFGMQPIYRTIINLLNDNYLDERDLIKIKYIDLVELIINLNYAEFINRKLVPTSKLFELNSFFNNSDVKTAEAFLGIMLSNYYDYLSRTLRIIHFVPYVRVSTSYYENAIEYGELLRMSIDTLRIRLREYYKRSHRINIKKRIGLNTLVTELAEAGVLSYDGNYITGKNKIYSQLLYLRDTMPITEDLNPYL